MTVPHRTHAMAACPEGGDVLIAWPEGTAVDRGRAALDAVGLRLDPAALDAVLTAPVAAWVDGRLVGIVRPTAGPGAFGWRRAGERASIRAGEPLVLACADGAISDDELAALTEGLLSRADGPDGVTVVRDGFDAAGARARARATILTRQLTDLSASELTPGALAERAREVAHEAGLTCEVLDVAELERRGFGGLLAVGGGSSHPPCLVELRTTPEIVDGALTLVGKGLTFDSGGVQVKGETMGWMRADMGGAAVVVGVMRAIAELGCTTPVRALLACAENRDGVNAYLPGDVITQYDGTRTEITHTDAEGRIVLADAMAYARERHPAAIIDVATLTDPFTLGTDIAPVMGTSAELTGRVRAAGERTGEPTWELPLWPGYRSWIASGRADRRNMHIGHEMLGIPLANTIVGGLFLEQFAGEVPWLHFDVVGPGVRADPQTGDLRATGFGAAALTRLVLDWGEA